MKYFTAVVLSVLSCFVANSQAHPAYKPKAEWQYCVARVYATLPPHTLLGNNSKVVTVYSFLFRSSGDLSHNWGDYLEKELKKYSGRYDVQGPVCGQGTNPANNPHRVAASELDQVRQSTQGIDNPTQIFPYPDGENGFTVNQDYYSPVLLSYEEVRGDECFYGLPGYIFLPDGPGNPACFPSLNHNIPDTNEKPQTAIIPYNHKNLYDPKASLDTSPRSSNPDPHPIQPKKLPDGCKYTDASSSEVSCN